MIPLDPSLPLTRHRELLAEHEQSRRSTALRRQARARRLARRAADLERSAQRAIERTFR